MAFSGSLGFPSWSNGLGPGCAFSPIRNVRNPFPSCQ
jgi:hypothetical protein